MAEEKKEAVKTRRPSAVKRDIQARKRREKNRQFTSQIKTAIRHFTEELKNSDSAAQKDRLSEIYRLMDKGQKKGIVPANAARRTKSRLASQLATKA